MGFCRDNQPAFCWNGGTDLEAWGGVGAGACYGMGIWGVVVGDKGGVDGYLEGDYFFFFSCFLWRDKEGRGGRGEGVVPRMPRSSLWGTGMFESLFYR